MHQNMGRRKSPSRKNSNVIRHYFRMKRQTNSRQHKAMEITKSYSWTPPLPASIAKSTHSQEISRKRRTNSSTKIWKKATLHPRTPPTASLPSWSLRKTRRRKDISLTIAPLTQSPGRTSPHSQISNSVSKTCKEWNYSASSTSAGVTTTSAYGKAINGKPHSKHVGDYLNPK